MEYRTVREFATRWQVCPRVVQDYCRTGRIPGAQKYGAAWMLPADAQKPADLRRAEQPEPEPLYPGLFLLEDLPLDGRSPDVLAAALPDAEHRRQFYAELQFLQGDLDGAAAGLAAMPPGSPFALSVLHGKAMACICQADYPAFSACVNALERLHTRYADRPQIGAAAELSQATLLVSLYAAAGCPDWLRACDFSALPAATHPFAAYVYARYLHTQGETMRALGAADVALALHSGAGLTVPTVYLELLRCIALIELDRADQARRLLTELFAKAQVYHLYMPFAENLPALRGELETVVKRDFPAHYKPLLRLWRLVNDGWVEIHNRTLGKTPPPALTLKEYQLGHYLCEGLSYKQISARMGLRTATVNNYIQTLREKLGVKTTAEVVARLRWV